MRIDKGKGKSKSTKKPASSKASLTRDKSRGKAKSTKNMQRKHLVGIAKLAKLSISTLVKWDDGSLPVKPETELKIFKATDLFYEQEVLRLEEYLQSLTEIEERIAARKKSVKLAIQAIQKKEVKKRAD